MSNANSIYRKYFFKAYNNFQSQLVDCAYCSIGNQRESYNCHYADLLMKQAFFRWGTGTSRAQIPASISDRHGGKPMGVYCRCMQSVEEQWVSDFAHD